MERILLIKPPICRIMILKVVGKFPGGSYVRKKLEKRDFHHPESAQSVPAVADSGLCDHLPERHHHGTLFSLRRHSGGVLPDGHD